MIAADKLIQGKDQYDVMKGDILCLQNQDGQNHAEATNTFEGLKIGELIKNVQNVFGFDMVVNVIQIADGENELLKNDIQKSMNGMCGVSVSGQ